MNKIYINEWNIKIKMATVEVERDNCSTCFILYFLPYLIDSVYAGGGEIINN